MESRLPSTAFVPATPFVRGTSTTFPSRSRFQDRPSCRRVARLRAVASDPTVDQASAPSASDSEPSLVSTNIEVAESQLLEESAIKSLEDVEKIVDLADEFDLSDLRIVDNGVEVEITRHGGRGFEDGRLAKPREQPLVTAAEDVTYASSNEEVHTEFVEEETFTDEAEEEGAGVELAPLDIPDSDAVNDSDFVVTSNRVGFFFSGARNKPPLVNVGDHVSFNQPVCIIEQLGQQYVYLSEVSGTVHKIFVEDSEPVQYGTQVMAIRPD